MNRQQRETLPWWPTKTKEIVFVAFVLPMSGKCLVEIAGCCGRMGQGAFHEYTIWLSDALKGKGLCCFFIIISLPSFLFIEIILHLLLLILFLNGPFDFYTVRDCDECIFSFFSHMMALIIRKYGVEFISNLNLTNLRTSLIIRAWIWIRWDV